jgi:beta-phosphoglucomutase
MTYPGTDAEGRSGLHPPRSVQSMDAGPLKAAILDVDGVLLASPHERAWREALVGLADPARFTTAVYQAAVAGKPRMDGALAALQALGVADAAGHVDAYAERKQARLEELIAGGHVAAFPDALRFVAALSALGWPMAVASSSKNANAMLERIHLADGRDLLDVFKVNVCGRDLAHGKPDPEIFEIAARELHMTPEQCFVAEDAPAGIEAARAGGMAALGVARLHDEAGLYSAQADLVVQSLDDVHLDTLARGLLCPARA